MYDRPDNLYDYRTAIQTTPVLFIFSGHKHAQDSVKFKQNFN